METKMPSEEEVLTVQDAAVLLKTTATEVVALLESGRLPGLELATGNWRLSRGALLAILSGTNHSPNVIIDGDRDVLEAPEVKVKIGELVRQILSPILEAGALPANELQLLHQADYCKKTFGVSFPVLRSVVTGRDLASQRRVGQHSRYWNRVFPGNYLVTSEWYEWQRQDFLVWAARFRRGA